MFSLSRYTNTKHIFYRNNSLSSFLCIDICLRKGAFTNMARKNGSPPVAEVVLSAADQSTPETQRLGSQQLQREKKLSDFFLVRSKNNTTYCLIGNPIIAGNSTQRFLVLQNTTLHSGPLSRRNAMFWFRGAWPSSCSNGKRSISSLKLSEDLLKLLVEVT